MYNVQLYSRVAPSAWTWIHFGWAQDAPAMWKRTSFSESEKDDYLFEAIYLLSLFLSVEAVVSSPQS